MATKTEHFNLNKVEYTDAIRSSITAYNDNFDILDEWVYGLHTTQESEILSLAEQIKTKANAEDLQGLASEDFVLEQINALDIPEDLSEYATKDDIDNAIGVALQEVY